MIGTSTPAVASTHSSPAESNAFRRRPGQPVYVDYGHSPDAFSTTIDAIRPFTTGCLIMVFGADGDRDPSKREEMGRIAAEGSDVLIVTDYNPRFEDAAAIRATLLAGAATATNPAEC